MGYGNNGDKRVVENSSSDSVKDELGGEKSTLTVRIRIKQTSGFTLSHRSLKSFDVLQELEARLATW